MHTKPLTEEYVAQIPYLATKAFDKTALLVYLMPSMSEHPDAYRYYWTKRHAQYQNSPGTVTRVCVSDDNDEWYTDEVGEELLGYVVWTRQQWKDDIGKDDVWQRQDSFLKRFNREALKLEAKYVSMFNLDIITSKEREAEFTDSMRANKCMRPVTKGNNGFLWLADLAVDPIFQRRGIGKRLLAWGFDKADAENLPIGQWASVEGDRLYRQVGFEEVGAYEVANIRGTGYIRWPNGKRPEAVTEDSPSL